MKVDESFVVSESVERVWEFISNPEDVAACVPGVESVEELDPDNFKVELTQSVGPMTATFALRMTVVERVEGQRLAFTATGRVVRGASGSVRSTNAVNLESVDGGNTRVVLEADVAMGGMLGSVGQKVIAKQAAQVTRDFATSLERALKGEPVPGAAGTAEAIAAERTAAGAEGAGRPVAVGGLTIDASDPRVVGGAFLLVALIAWLFGRSSGSNAAYAQIVKKGNRR